MPRRENLDLDDISAVRWPGHTLSNGCFPKPLEVKRSALSHDLEVLPLLERLVLALVLPAGLVRVLALVPQAQGLVLAAGVAQAQGLVQGLVQGLLLQVVGAECDDAVWEVLLQLHPHQSQLRRVYASFSCAPRPGF